MKPVLMLDQTQIKASQEKTISDINMATKNLTTYTTNSHKTLTKYSKSNPRTYKKGNKL